MSVRSPGSQCASITLTRRAQRIEVELGSARPTSRGRDLTSGGVHTKPVDAQTRTRCTRRDVESSSHNQRGAVTAQRRVQWGGGRWGDAPHVRATQGVLVTE